MPIQVRPLRPADLDQVFEIERQSFSAPWSREMLRSEGSNPNSRSLVATIEGGVVAYLLTARILDELNVQTIAVKTEYRRAGIARKLFDVLLETARTDRVRAVHLETRQSNQAAKALYRELGFVEVGLRPKYYRSPTEDALLLTLYL